METKQMTVQEVLEITIRELGEIRVPVGMLEQVGVPIARGISNLKECVRAIQESEQNRQAEPGQIIDLGEIGDMEDEPAAEAGADGK